VALPNFYGLAVKTGSIALQTFICCFFVCLFFCFFLALQKKVGFWGRIFFPDSPQKTNGTPCPYFCEIFTSFGVKNISALFREID